MPQLDLTTFHSLINHLFVLFFVWFGLFNSSVGPLKSGVARSVSLPQYEKIRTLSFINKMQKQQNVKFLSSCAFFFKQPNFLDDKLSSLPFVTAIAVGLCFVLPLCYTSNRYTPTNRRFFIMWACIIVTGLCFLVVPFFSFITVSFIKEFEKIGTNLIDILHGSFLLIPIFLVSFFIVYILCQDVIKNFDIPVGQLITFFLIFICFILINVNYGILYLCMTTLIYMLYLTQNTNKITTIYKSVKLTDSHKLFGLGSFFSKFFDESSKNLEKPREIKYTFKICEGSHDQFIGILAKLVSGVNDRGGNVKVELVKNYPGGSITSTSDIVVHQIGDRVDLYNCNGSQIVKLSINLPDQYLDVSAQQIGKIILENLGVRVVEDAGFHNVYTDILIKDPSVIENLSQAFWKIWEPLSTSVSTMYSSTSSWINCAVGVCDSYLDPICSFFSEHPIVAYFATIAVSIVVDFGFLVLSPTLTPEILLRRKIIALLFVLIFRPFD